MKNIPCNHWIGCWVPCRSRCCCSLSGPVASTWHLKLSVTTASLLQQRFRSKPLPMPVRPLLGNEKCPLCSATFFLFFSCLQHLRLTPWKVPEVSFGHDSFSPQKFWSSKAWRSPVSLPPQSDAIKLRGLVGEDLLIGELLAKQVADE